MVQRDANRFEEYIALRAELLQLLANSRQILYVTAAFMIASFAWFLGQPLPTRIAVSWFAFFLQLVLFLSAVIYSVNTSQVYRIGGFLAVFWESHDPERHLVWHRFNRRGPPGGFLPDAAMLVYVSSTATTVLLIAIVAVARQIRPFEPATLAAITGIREAVAFSQLNRFLRRQRDRFELEWRMIRGSRERMDQIHDEYETIPS